MEVVLIQKKPRPVMRAEVADGDIAPAIHMVYHAPAETLSLSRAKIIRDAAPMFTLEELEVRNLRDAIFGDRAVEYAALLFMTDTPELCRLSTQAINYIEGNARSETRGLPAIEIASRHVQGNSNRLANGRNETAGL